MAKKKSEVIAEMTYKDCEIKVVQQEDQFEIQLDEKPVRVQRDPDTGAYASPELPFRTYGSLEELAKAMVDAGLANNQDD